MNIYRRHTHEIMDTTRRSSVINVKEGIKRHNCTGDTICYIIGNYGETIPN